MPGPHYRSTPPGPPALLIALCLLALFSSVFVRASTQAPAPQSRIFPSASLIRLPLPEQAAGRWALFNPDGNFLRGGDFREAERVLYLPGLPAGLYSLNWGIEGDAESTPTLQAPAADSLRLLVHQQTSQFPRDPFFTLQIPQLGRLAWLLYAEQTLGAVPADDSLRQNYLRCLDYARTLGASRILTGFHRGMVTLDTGEKDWGGLDKLLADGEERGLRFVVQLDARAQDDAEFAVELLRRYGFKLDIFQLFQHEIAGRSADQARDTLDQARPLFDAIRERSPYAAVGLGPLRVAPSEIGFMAPDEFLATIIQQNIENPACNLVSHYSGGDHRNSRAIAHTLDNQLSPTPLGQLPRAIALLAPPRADDSNDSQMHQALELAKTLVYHHHNNYRYAATALADLTDQDPERPHAQGLFRADGEIRPAAQAWRQCARRIAGAQPVPRLALTRSEIELYGFSRSGRCILALWVPSQAETPRQVVTMSWFGKAPIRVYDSLGRERSNEHDSALAQLIEQGQVEEAEPGGHHLLVGKQPLFFEIDIPAENVGW